MSSNSFDILKINKITIKNIPIEASYVSTIDIFESLTQPGITGYINIQDYQGLRELGSIFAGDEITFSFGIQDESNDLNLSFYIYTDEGSSINPLLLYDTLHLGFCSKWLIDGLSKAVSRPYKDKFIHEIIDDILKTECPEAEIGFIEPTIQKLEHFLSPRWSPIHTINYLLSFAMNAEKIGGYIMWTDLKTKKINITTIDYLAKGNFDKSTISFNILPGNKRYAGQIVSSNFESSYDSIRMINSGLQDTIFYGFNFDKKKFTTSKDKNTDLKNKRLSKKLPIQSKYKEDKKYSRYRFSPLFPSTDNSIAGDDTKLDNLVNGSLYGYYTFLTSDLFKINIETIGETTRRVGQLVLLEYPSQNNNAGGNDDNNQLKADYLIREIRHSFSSYTDYKQYITLIIDGYNNHNADMIQW